MQDLNAMERLFNAALPEKTESYTPISHKVIDEKTRSILADMGFQLKSTRYNSSADGLLGQCQHNIQYGDDAEMGLMVAWQNSYNKLVSFKYAVGAHVMVCSNGMVAGDLGAYRRKHTGTADQEAFEMIRNYLTNAKSIYEKLIEDREHLKRIDLTPTRMAEIMGKMFIDKEIITSTQINIMKREMYSPTFEYGVPRHNAWALYNYATHAFKEDSPRSWMKRHVDLHNFFNEEFELPQGESFQTESVLESAPVFIETHESDGFSSKEVSLKEQEQRLKEDEKKPVTKKESSLIELLDDF